MAAKPPCVHEPLDVDAIGEVRADQETADLPDLLEPETTALRVCSTISRAVPTIRRGSVLRRHCPQVLYQLVLASPSSVIFGCQGVRLDLRHGLGLPPLSARKHELCNTRGRFGLGKNDELLSIQITRNATSEASTTLKNDEKCMETCVGSLVPTFKLRTSRLSDPLMWEERSQLDVSRLASGTDSLHDTGGVATECLHRQVDRFDLVGASEPITTTTTSIAI